MSSVQVSGALASVALSISPSRECPRLRREPAYGAGTVSRSFPIMALVILGLALAFISSSPQRLRRQHAARATLLAADKFRPSENNRKLRLAKLDAAEADIKRAEAAAEKLKQAEVAQYRASLEALEQAMPAHGKPAALKRDYCAPVMRQLRELHSKQLVPDAQCLSTAIRTCGRARDWRQF